MPHQRPERMITGCAGLQRKLTQTDSGSFNQWSKPECAGWQDAAVINASRRLHRGQGVSSVCAALAPFCPSLHLTVFPSHSALHQYQAQHHVADTLAPLISLGHLRQLGLATDRHRHSHPGRTAAGQSSHSSQPTPSAWSLCCDRNPLIQQGHPSWTHPIPVTHQPGRNVPQQSAASTAGLTAVGKLNIGTRGNICRQQPATNAATAATAETACAAHTQEPGCGQDGRHWHPCLWQLVSSTPTVCLRQTTMLHACRIHTHSWQQVLA
jgi:hypothetical protein